MFNILLRFNTFMRRRPLLFNTITYGSFYTFAEFAQQSYNRTFKQVAQPSSIISNPEIPHTKFDWIQKFNETLGLLDNNISILPGEYKWSRLKRYAIYGCFLAGPILHGWYKWLDTVFKGKSLKIVLVKLIADQFILTPPLIGLFFISMSLMEGKSDFFAECKAKFITTFKTSCLYWIPVQFINFIFISPTLRVTYVSIAAFCWVNILCYLKSKPLSEYEKI